MRVLSGLLLTAIALASPQEMPGTGVISGRILDANGRPAVGVLVVPLFYQLANDGTQKLQSVAGKGTNDHGEFRFFGLPPRRYLVSFSNSEDPPPPLRLLEDRDSSGTSQGLYPGVTSMERASSIEVRPNEEFHLKDIILAPERYGSIAIRVNNPPGTEAKDIQIGFDLTTTEFYYPPDSFPWGENVGIPRGPTIRVDAGMSIERQYWPTQPGRYQVSVGWTNRDEEKEIISMAMDFDGTSLSRDITLARPEGKLTIRAILEKPDGALELLKQVCVDLGDFATSRVTYVVSENKGYLRIPPAGFLPSPKTGIDGSASLPFPPGRYDITAVYDDFGSTPENQYVASARQGNRDALIDGIVISDNEASVEIRMRAGAGKINGIVLDSQNRIVSRAQVALLPGAPLNASKLADLYKTTLTKSD